MVRGEKCGLGKNPKSETICLTFSPSRFRLARGNSLSISGRAIAREKHFKLLAFGLMLIGQVKQPIWIQTDIYRVRSIVAAFKLLVYRQILITRNILRFYYMLTVALDERKQKPTEFLKFLF